MKHKMDEHLQVSRLRLSANRHDMQPAEVEAHYICDSCGEEIVVPIDVLMKICMPTWSQCRSNGRAAYGSDNL